MFLSRIAFGALVGAVIGGIRGWIWHREKQERRARATRMAATALPPMATVVALAGTSIAGPDWGWVWVHAHAERWKGLGYYYRDSALGPSLRIFADLLQNPDEATLRSAIATALPSGGSSVRLGPHRIVTTDGASENDADVARATFAAGRDPDGTVATILLRVSRHELAIFALPARPAFVDTLF